MSEPLELRVPVIYDGSGMNRAAGDVDKVSASTKALNDAIAAQVNPMNRARQAADDYAKQEAKNAANRETYWANTKKQFEQEEAAWRRMQGVHEQALKQNAAMNQEFANSVQQWITNPLAMAGKAVGNFAQEYGKIGVAAMGMGTAAAIAGKMVFDLTRQVGTAALEMRNLASRTGMGVETAQLVSQTSGVLGINPNAMVTAMRTLSQGLSDISGEGRKTKEALAEIGITGANAFLPMDQLMPMIFDKLNEVGNAMEKDRLTIGVFGRSGLELMPLIENFKRLSGAVTEQGAIISKDGIAKLAEYEEHMWLIGLRWQGVINILSEHAIGTIEWVVKHPAAFMPAVAGAAVTGYEGAMALGHALFDDNQPEPQPAYTGTIDQAHVDAQARSDRNDYIQNYNTTHGSAQDRQAAQLKNLEDARTVAQSKFSSGAGTQQDFEAADKRVEAFKAGIAAAKALTEAQKALTNEQMRAADSVRELAKRSAEMEAKAGGGALSPIQKYNGDVAALNMQRADTLRKTPTGPGGIDLTPSINQSYDQQIRALFITMSDEIAKAIRADRDKDTARQEEFGAFAAGERGKRKPEYMDPAYSPLDPRLNPQLPYYTPTSEEIKRTEMGAGAALNIAKRGQTAGAQATMTQGVDDTTANQILKMQMDYNNAVLSGQERIKANEKALEENTDRRYANQLKYEEELAALQEAQQKAFQSKAVDLFHSLLTGHGAQFGRSLGMGQADKIIGNAAGMGFEQFGLGSVVPQMSSGFMGSLLKGTVMNTGIGNDPVTSTNLNTVATDRNTQKLAELSTKIGGPSTGTASAPGGNPLGLIGAISAASGAAGGSNPFASYGGLTNGLGGGTVSSGGTASANPYSDFGGLTTGLSAATTGIASTNPLVQATAMIKTATKFSAMSGDFGSGMKDPLGILFGSTGPGGGYTGTATTAQDVGAGVGIAGAGLGAYKGISQMSKGGAGNISGGLGTTLMSIAPLTGPAAPFIMAAGMAADLVSAILGDPKVNRANSIATQLQFSQFMAPVAQNVTMDTSGHYADTNFLGQARTSDLSPYPVTQKPYYDLNNNVMVPGRTISSFGAPVGPQSAPPAASVIIHAMDSQSFQDWGTKNADALEHVMTNVVQRNSGAFISTTRNQLG